VSKNSQNWLPFTANDVTRFDKQ